MANEKGIYKKKGLLFYSCEVEKKGLEGWAKFLYIQEEEEKKQESISKKVPWIVFFHVKKKVNK